MVGHDPMEDCTPYQSWTLLKSAGAVIRITPDSDKEHSAADGAKMAV